jgi:hypothetical protein
MAQRIAIAFGAGIVAALLFAVSAKATALAMALSILSPLPIVIASLNWGVDMGAIAAFVATGGVAALDPASGAIFGAGVVLPAWALSGIASLRSPIFHRGKSGVDRSLEWCPIGIVVTAAAVIGALIGLGALISLIVVYSGFESGVDELSKQIAPIYEHTLGELVVLPAGVTFEQFANEVVREAPPVLAPLAFLLFCGNLYVGGRVAQISQALKRPWPDLPEALVLPRALAVALAISLGLALLLQDPARLAAWIVVGVFAAAFALQGLALAHALTRGFQYRNPLLLVLYLASALESQWILPILAFAGVIESFLSLRAKRVAATSAKPLDQRES